MKQQRISTIYLYISDMAQAEHLGSSFSLDSDSSRMQWSKRKLETEKTSSDNEEDVYINSRCTSPLFKTPMRKWKIGRRQRSPNVMDSLPHITMESAEIVVNQLTSTPLYANMTSPEGRNEVNCKITDNLATLLDEANDSWTSSLATPQIQNVTWTNLNTEEKKVFLPSHQDSFNSSWREFPQVSPEDVKSADESDNQISYESPSAAECPNRNKSQYSDHSVYKYNERKKDTPQKWLCESNYDHSKKEYKYKRSKKMLNMDETHDDVKNTVSKRLFQKPSFQEQLDVGLQMVPERNDTVLRNEENPKCSNNEDCLKNMQGGMTQNFLHDLSFSTLEEICQASELMITDGTSPVDNNGETSNKKPNNTHSLSTVPEDNLIQKRKSDVSADLTLTPLTSRNSSTNQWKTLSKKKKIKFVNCKASNSLLLHPVVKQNVDSEYVADPVSKKQCIENCTQGDERITETQITNNSSMDVSLDKVKFRVKTIKSVKENRIFMYTPLVENSVHPQNSVYLSHLKDERQFPLKGEKEGSGNNLTFIQAFDKQNGVVKNKCLYDITSEPIEKHKDYSILNGDACNLSQKYSVVDTFKADRQPAVQVTVSEVKSTSSQKSEEPADKYSMTDTQMVNAAEDIEILLQLVEEESSEAEKFHNQSTITSKNCKISPKKENLIAKDVLVSCDGKVSGKPVPKGGFSTASGKNIPISEDALKKGREFFSDESVIFSCYQDSANIQMSMSNSELLLTNAELRPKTEQKVAFLEEHHFSGVSPNKAMSAENVPDKNKFSLSVTQQMNTYKINHEIPVVPAETSICKIESLVLTFSDKKSVPEVTNIKNSDTLNTAFVTEVPKNVVTNKLNDILCNELHHNPKKMVFRNNVCQKQQQKKPLYTEIKKKLTVSETPLIKSNDISAEMVLLDRTEVMRNTCHESVGQIIHEKSQQKEKVLGKVLFPCNISHEDDVATTNTNFLPPGNSGKIGGNFLACKSNGHVPQAIVFQDITEKNLCKLVMHKENVCVATVDELDPSKLTEKEMDNASLKIEDIGRTFVKEMVSEELHMKASSRTDTEITMKEESLKSEKRKLEGTLTLCTPEMKSFSVTRSIPENSLNIRRKVGMEETTGCGMLEMKGFSAACGRSVAASKEVLKRARKMFAEIGSLETSDKADLPPTKTKTIPVCSVSHNSSVRTFTEEFVSSVTSRMKDSSSVQDEIVTPEECFQKERKISIEETVIPRKAKLKVILTASSRAVPVPKQNLKALKKRCMGEKANLGAARTNGLSAITYKMHTASQESLKRTREEEESASPGISKGISTASKTPVALEETVKRARNLVSEPESPGIHEIKGFSTTNGKLALFENSLKNAAKTFTAETLGSEIPQMNSFSADTGRAVAVCEDYLNKERMTFANLSSLGRSEMKGCPTDSKSDTVLEEFSKGERNIFIQSESPGLLEGKCFSTAGGKNVPVSEESLKRSKSIFIEESESPRLSEGKCFSTASGKRIPVSEDSLKKARKLLVEEPSTPEGLEMKGFSTASGKNIPVSEESLKRAKSIFIEESESPRISEGKCFSTASGKRIPVSEDSLKKARKLLVEEPSTPEGLEMKGFSTASGKNVSVSEESLKRAKSIFIEESESPRLSEGKCFSTASGKRIPVSEDSLKKARKLLVEEPSTPEGLEMKGFSTASGKNVSVSEESLKRAKSIFIEESESPRLSEGKCFSTASGKRIPVSEDSLKKARKLLVEEPSTPEGLEMKGFSTASGKNVPVSEESLKRAKSIFIEESESPRLSEGKCFSTASGKRIPVSEDSLKKARKLLVEEPFTPEGLEMKGFSTASGKNVSVSEESLKRAKSIFIEESESPRLSESKCFSTASGKRIPVSEDSLLKARKLLVVEPSTPEGLEMKGFSTASGKNVSVSEESLKRAKSIFIEESESSRLSEGKCFSTASGKRIPVSEDSLKKARKLLVEEPSTPEGLEMKGFSTASGKNVSVSEESLKRAKNVDEVECPTMRELSSCTANPFIVPQKYLSERKKTFRQIQSISDSHLSCDSFVYDSSLSPGLSFKTGVKKMEIRRGSKQYNDSNNHDHTYKDSVVCFPENSNDSVTNNQKPHEKSASRSMLNYSCKPDASATVQKMALHNCSRLTSLSQEVWECTSALLADELMTEKSFSQDIVHTKAACYTTCPEMLYDRDNAPNPLVSSADGEILVQPGSPVLGRSDRFKKIRKKQRNKKLDGYLSQESLTKITSTSFKVPYKMSATNASRTETKHKTAPCLAYDTPFWKNAQNLEVSYAAIDKAQKQAAEEQEIIIKKKKATKLQPCMGSVLLSKLTEPEKQLTWAQVTAGRVPGQYTYHQLKKYGLTEKAINITAENALEFRFSASDYYSPKFSSENTSGIPIGDGALLIFDEKSQAGVKEVRRSFLSSPSIEPGLVPQGWVSNHYRWLVWKLAATDRRFPHQFKSRCLTPNNLLLQLKYRYDREIDRNQRPALRRILEKDDAPGKRVVLCIANIFKCHPKNAEHNEHHEKVKSTPKYELEVTDGWYSTIAEIDKEMCRLIDSSVVTVGTKFVTHNAELLNCADGCHPLEATSAVKLKLHTNSTRRVRWHVKLGFCANPGPLPVSLSSVLPYGGIISCTTVVIARVYPMLYVERTADGKSVIRSEKLEIREAAAFERLHQQRVECIYSQERKDLFQQSAMKQNKVLQKVSHAKVAAMTSGEELCELLETAFDPSSIQAVLNEDQQKAVAEYQQENQIQLMHELETRVRQRLGDEKTVPRTVTSLYKVRCIDASVNRPQSVMLSVWRAGDEVVSLLKEGAIVKLFSATATGIRCGNLQLSAGRQTRYKVLPETTATEHVHFSQRVVTSIQQAVSRAFHPTFGELDTVGIVICTETGPPETKGFETLYLADADLVLLGISFWGSIKDYGWEDILQPGVIIAASNLQWRQGAANRWIPCAYASETSVFSQNPRQPHLKEAMETLKCHMHMVLSETNMNQIVVHSKQDIKDILSECENILSSVNRTHGAVRPSTKLSERRIPSANEISTVSAKKTAHIELTPVQYRLHKLQQYGNPPPLSPLSLDNRTFSLKRHYQVPLKCMTDIEVPPKRVMDFVSPNESPPLSLNSEPD